MVYRLYRVNGIDEPAEAGDFLGAYTDFDDALEARDEDVILLLGDLDGAPMLACHRIVGPGFAGPATDHAVISSVGRDHIEQTVDAVHAELRDTCRWLRAARAAARAGTVSD